MRNSPPLRLPLPLQPSSTSFSSLPDEIVASCLARISKCHYRTLSSVCKSFHSLLSSREIYTARSEIGAIEARLYFCLWLSTASRHRWFTLRTPDQTLISNGNEGGCELNRGLNLVPVKLSSSYAYARLGAAILAVGSEIYQIGGSYHEDKRSRIVRVLDCWSNTRRHPPNMRVARRRAKACFLDGKIYVMGGCRKREERMNWGEVFDIKTQTWKEKPLPSPSGDELDPNHKVLVFGGRLYVITKRNKHAYDPKVGRWLPEMGFVGLARIIITRRRRWCVIENLVFYEHCDQLWWYDLSSGMSLMVEGLTDLNAKRHCAYSFCHIRTKKILNYGNKLVIVWQKMTDLISKTKSGIQKKRTWFAVIRLEKRLTSSGSTIWGEIELLDSIVPGLYKFLTCLSVSL